MERLYSQRGQRLKRSELAEIFKLAENPDVISFAGGFPDPDWFLDEIAEIGAKVLCDRKGEALQYGPVPGLTEMRTFLAARSRKRNMAIDVPNIILTNGSLQGLDLLCRLFLEPNDTVLVETPTYVGAIQTFENNEAEVIHAPCDEEGLKIEALGALLDQLKATNRLPKFIYLIPTFQNPSGRVLGLERRKKLLELVSAYQIPILEDDAYGELRFEGTEIPTLKSLDQEEIVIYLGTFSKIFCPGIRLGWVAASEGIIEKLILLKQAIDQMSSPLAQILALECGKEGLIERQIQITSQGLQRKRDLALAALEKYFPSTTSWIKSEGGFHTWVTLPEEIDTLEMLPKIVRTAKVAYVAGPSFFADRSGKNCFRLCYSPPKEDVIVEGIRRLAEMFFNSVHVQS